MTIRHLLGSALFAAGLAAAPIVFAQQAAPSRGSATDLDTLMARALAHRDQNWKKLEQYVLDEREEFEVRDPGNGLMMGERRDYSWFLRDGFFVRSPVRANGATVSEPDRLAYEQQWLRQERGRQAARNRRARGANPAAADAAPDADPNAAPTDVGAFLKQSREPRFVSAGYFLEFVFEPGNYVVAGRETLKGRQVLRVEYYPTKLFDERNNRRLQERNQDRNGREAELRLQMNKTSLVTLWVDPASAEILKYTFTNLGLDFFPGSWLLRITDFGATIDMIEPFPDVWLPNTVGIQMAIALANGVYHLRYNLDYHDYKEAKAKATIRPPQ